MNIALEADSYGNVNWTQVIGAKIVNGSGDSGDFARNTKLSIFISESVVKNGSIANIVPMVSHIDHTEHAAAVLIMEQGVADLRGLTPVEWARAIIQNCAIPITALRSGIISTGRSAPQAGRRRICWRKRFLADGLFGSGLVALSGGACPGMHCRVDQCRHGLADASPRALFCPASGKFFCWQVRPRSFLFSSQHGLSQTLLLFPARCRAERAGRLGGCSAAGKQARTEKYRRAKLCLENCSLSVAAGTEAERQRPLPGRGTA
jgi:hypothetical protein